MDKGAKLYELAKRIYTKYTSVLYFIFFYALIFSYHVLIAGGPIGDWTVDTATYTHHLVAYSFGFCTKFLPGAIYHVFFKEVYAQQLNIYLRVLTLLFFAALAFFMARVMTLKKDKTEKKTLLVLLLFYLTGPCTFAIFTQQAGMLDFYWLLFGALFFFAVNNKYLKYLTPLVFVLAMLINFSSLVTYVALFALVLLYEALSNENAKARTGYGIIFVISVCVVAALFMYFLLYENANLKYDMQGFNAEISRRDKENYNYFVYFDYALYKYFDGGSGVNKYVIKDITAFLPSLGEKLPPTVAKPIASVLSLFAFTRTIYIGYLYYIIAFELIALAPLLVLFAAFWIHLIKKNKGLKRLVFIIALLQFYVTFIAGTLSSVDVGRWCTHAFLVQFTFVIYVAVKEKGAPEWFKKQFSKFREWQIVLYLMIYIFVQVPAYS